VITDPTGRLTVWTERVRLEKNRDEPAAPQGTDASGVRAPPSASLRFGRSPRKRGDSSLPAGQVFAAAGCY
jgi:hypothetical protein